MATKAKRKGRTDRPRDDRHARFVQEYAKDSNATRAAIAAGYSARCAAQQGSRLLRDAKVRGAVDQLLAAAAEANQITVERTQREIARIAYGDRRRLYHEDGRLKLPYELDDDAAALLSSLETEEMFEYVGKGEERSRELVGYTRKVKTWDKVRALEQCMSILGLHKSVNQAERGQLALTINLSGKSPRKESR